MPRLTAIPFPMTRFVPGSPASGPRPAECTPLTPDWSADPERWRESTDYLLGIDLFNAGYCWESHEALEVVWKQLRASATPASLRAAFAVQVLIQIAAARIKHEIANGAGVRTLLERSAANLALALNGDTSGRVMGVDLGAWHRDASAWFEKPVGTFPGLRAS